MTLTHWPRVKPAQVLSAAAFGLFLARFLYELAPLQFGFLSDWPGVIALCLISLLVTRYSLRLSLTPLLLLFVYVFWPEVHVRWALTLLIGSIALVVLQLWGLRRARWFDLILIASTLGLYLLTLGDHVGQADTFEWQVVMPQLGIGHPTGYPLFIMIGRLFALIPVGSMAWRTNLV